MKRIQTTFVNQNNKMTDRTRHKMHHFGHSVITLIIALMVAWCVGNSPVSASEQIAKSGQQDTESGDAATFSREQLQSPSIWLDFETFKKYEAALREEGLKKIYLWHQRRLGSRVFRVWVVDNAEDDTIHLYTYDKADDVWAMLPSILADMAVSIVEIKNEERVILVKDTGEGEPGGIGQLQVHSTDRHDTNIFGLTNLGVPVTPKAGWAFFNRLRFYLLERYRAEIAADEGIDFENSPIHYKFLIGGDAPVQKILMKRGFETAWAEVGYTLVKALGANILDMNRGEGIYYVGFSESNISEYLEKRKNVGVPKHEQYQVFVSDQGEQSEISVAYTGDKTTEDYYPSGEQKVLLFILGFL